MALALMLIHRCISCRCLIISQHGGFLKGCNPGEALKGGAIAIFLVGFVVPEEKGRRRLDLRLSVHWYCKLRVLVRRFRALQDFVWNTSWAAVVECRCDVSM